MTPPKVILITSGPTQEFIDPVRFISNPSTGRIGYELALEARLHNYQVILISGPTNLDLPKNVQFIPVKDAFQMRKMVKKMFRHADCLIMAAAVSDFRPLRYNPQKIKVRGKMNLKLVRTPDILKEVSGEKGKKILVGFALESENLLKNAKLKLKSKKLDFIVANRLAKNEVPFGNSRVSYLIIDKAGNIKRLKNSSKKQLAKAIFDKIDNLSNT